MPEKQQENDTPQHMNMMIQVSDEIAISKRMLMLLSVTVFILCILIAVVSYRMGKTAPKQEPVLSPTVRDKINSPSPIVSPLIEDTDTTPPSQQTETTEQTLPQDSTTVPADWQTFTDTDPDYQFTTTLSAPPGFTFSFSGSEWTLMNADGTELWDYQTSRQIQEDGTLVNTYDGGSRRVWYQEFLRNEAGDVFEPDTVQSVEEYGLAGTSYLAVTVAPAISPEAPETHYLYYQNGLIHVLRPVSAVAKSPSAVIPQNIGPILSSLEVEEN